MYRPNTKSPSRFLPVLTALVFAAPALGVQVRPPASPSAPCSVVEAFGGRIQILDDTRTSVKEVENGLSVPCGGWVSVGAGWVRLKHREGFRLSLGSGGFVQARDSSDSPGDHYTLYKGEAHLEAGSGTGELRVITANSRVRVSRGRALLTYNLEEEESQLVTLENRATIENRFQNTRRMVVKAGEASSLNFKALRTVPTSPAAVGMASVRAKLADLHLDEGQRLQSLASAKDRMDRSFASSLVDGEEASDPGKAEGKTQGRSVASSKADERDPNRYLRHEPDDDDGEMRSQWVKKMVAGHEAGERILFPDKYYGRPQRVKINVEDHGVSVSKGAKPSEEEQERKRLLEEISQIRPD